MRVAEYAKAHGITTAGVRLRIKRGEVAAHKEGNAWVIDSSEKTAGDDLAGIKRRKSEAEARLKEIELSKAEGKWIPYEDAVAEVMEACQMWWDGLRRVGNRVAEDVMNAETKAQVVKHIQSEINRVMVSMRDDALAALEELKQKESK